MATQAEIQAAYDRALQLYYQYCGATGTSPDPTYINTLRLNYGFAPLAQALPRPSDVTATVDVYQIDEDARQFDKDNARLIDQANKDRDAALKDRQMWADAYTEAASIGAEAEMARAEAGIREAEIMAQAAIEVAGIAATASKYSDDVKAQIAAEQRQLDRERFMAIELARPGDWVARVGFYRGQTPEQGAALAQAGGGTVYGGQVGGQAPGLPQPQPATAGAAPAALVGERGPELAAALPGGGVQITPLQQQQAQWLRGKVPGMLRGGTLGSKPPVTPSRGAGQMAEAYTPATSAGEGSPYGMGSPSDRGPLPGMSSLSGTRQLGSTRSIDPAEAWSQFLMQQGQKRGSDPDAVRGRLMREALAKQYPGGAPQNIIAHYFDLYQLPDSLRPSFGLPAVTPLSYSEQVAAVRPSWKGAPPVSPAGWWAPPGTIRGGVLPATAGGTATPTAAAPSPIDQLPFLQAARAGGQYNVPSFQAWTGPTTVPGAGINTPVPPPWQYNLMQFQNMTRAEQAMLAATWRSLGMIPGETEEEMIANAYDAMRRSAFTGMGSALPQYGGWR